MNTIHHYSALISTVNSMQTRLTALGYDFKEIAPITPIDEQMIDTLVTMATQMLTDAAALKLIAYDPTLPEEPAP
tara:strand:+ start:4036 stop:4260 length:225 start_codon:yes stop_codon:yes gene_type:complete